MGLQKECGAGWVGLVLPGWVSGPAVAFTGKVVGEVSPVGVDDELGVFDQDVVGTGP